MKKSLVLILPVVILVSCATLPPERPAGGWIGVLPPESTFFLSLNIPYSGELLLSILKEKNISAPEIHSIMDRTERIYAGVHLSRITPTAFSLVALGNYPAFLVNIPLKANKEWQKVESPRPYWQQANGILQVAVPENNLVFAANGSIERMLNKLENPGSNPFPWEAVWEMERADALIFFPVLPSTDREAGLERLPIKEVWISAYRSASKEEPTYELLGVFNLIEVKNKRAVEALFRLLMVAWLRKAEVSSPVEQLKSLKISVSAERVRISGLRFSEAEIVDFFGLFLSK